MSYLFYGSKQVYFTKKPKKVFSNLKSYYKPALRYRNYKSGKLDNVDNQNPSKYRLYRPKEWNKGAYKFLIFLGLMFVVIIIMVILSMA